MRQTRILAFVLLMAGVPAHASNSWVANCENLKDPAMQARIGICTNHLGCKLFLESLRDCATAGGFLDKLTAVTSGRQTISSSDVFEAAVPPVTDDPEFTRASQAIKSRFGKQTGNVISTDDIHATRISWTFDGPWVIEGPLVNGKHQGVCILINGKGTLFRGEFVAGLQAGNGEYINLRANVRDAGNMQKFGLNGHGIRRIAERRFSGQFKDDRPHGLIIFTSTNGHRYEGEYANGKPHGRGLEIYANGGRYEGEYANGKKHGRGLETYPNGDRYDRYEGEYADGKRHGQGTYTFPNGKRFVGSFANGRPFNGQETAANGEVIAVFVDGVKQGSGAEPNRAAQQAALDQQQADAERERKETRRRDRREALGVLRNYADTSAAMGNRKPSRQLAAVEILAGNSPQEILASLKAALIESLARNPSISRRLAAVGSLRNLTAQDALALLRPALMDAANRDPKIAQKLAILEALTSSSPDEAMGILKPMLAEAANRRLVR